MVTMQVIPPNAERETGTYLAYWTVGEVDNLRKEVERQVAGWLLERAKTRSWDPAVDQEGRYLGPNSEELVVIHHENSQGISTQFRLIEGEAADPRRTKWRTTLTTHAPRHGEPWIVLRVSNNGGIAAKPPRVAARLLDALRLYDGDTWMSSEPRKHHRDDAERVADAVTNIDRRGLYSVVGTSEDIPVDPLMALAEQWAKDMTGLAQMAVLGPEATRMFNEIMGPAHGVEPGTLRTYLPDADPAVPDDSLRHRVLSTSRLAGPTGWVRSRLGSTARTHASEYPLPTAVETVLRTLTRVHDGTFVTLLTESATTAASTPTILEVPTVSSPEPTITAPTVDTDMTVIDTVSDKAERYLGQVELVKSFFNIDVIDEAELERALIVARDEIGPASALRVTEELEARQKIIDELESEVHTLRAASEDAELDLTIAQQENQKAQDEIRWLRQQIAKAGDRDAYAALPDEEITERPSSFEALTDKFAEFECKNVVFTGDAQQVEDLDEYDTVGRLAGVAWDCFLALTDYTRAREDRAFDGSLADYIQSPPRGYATVSLRKFARSESKSVRANKDLSAERLFAVPTSVESSGRVRMVTHFKLGMLGRISPRMYVYDNWPGDGKVYVGYIGPHLTTATGV